MGPAFNANFFSSSPPRPLPSLTNQEQPRERGILSQGEGEDHTAFLFEIAHI